MAVSVPLRSPVSPRYRMTFLFLKRNPHHDTTYANKIFQYMALGKPLVVSDCPAQETLVKDVNCGLVHEAANSDDLAVKLNQLLEDSGLATQLGLNGKQAVNESLDWANTSIGLINFYKEFGKLKE